MILLNLDLIRFQLFLLFRDDGIKYPEMKNIINMINMSR